jgi:hypothetical protein
MLLRPVQFAAVVLASVASVMAPAAVGQDFPRAADGRPDLSGIWQAFNDANWNIEPHTSGPAAILRTGAIGATPPGMGIVEGNGIPYQDWALAERDENFANRATEDPEARCYLPGVPRATYIPQPFQIFQTGGDILIAYQYAGAVRTVYMKDPGPAPANSWMGWSVGHWEGDTLVVDVSSQNEGTWFDRAGNFHSDQLHVVERYTPIDADHLLYEANIEDPMVFTRPWQIRMPLYRRIEEDARLMEFKCVEFSEELIYGHLRRQPDPQ